MTTQLSWHYRIRLKHTSWIWRNGNGCCQLKDFHFERGEALCWQKFVLAIATLYVTDQGVEVVATGKRRWVDTYWFRGNS